MSESNQASGVVGRSCILRGTIVRIFTELQVEWAVGRRKEGKECLCSVPVQ